MCGICGVININNKSVDESLLFPMMKTMKHRGPDDEGTFIEKNVGLGFVRLSILDLSSAGHQPMFSGDKRYVIVFNGEIFNYLELREELKLLNHVFHTGTDTEVLLAAYKEWDADCLNHFNGMWAFVIFDRTEKKIFAARDRYGIKPFYYIQTQDFFAFASEIPPLLSLLENKPKPDYQSIFDYLVFNRTDQTERTFFEDVKKLQHGYSIRCKSESSNINPEASIKKWYDLRERVSNSEGFKNPEDFRQIFSSAIGLRLRSDVPVGVCLSGGLDSSSIVSVLLKDHNKSDLNTFSAVYERGQYGDETEFIKEYEPTVNDMFFITPTASTLMADLSDFVKAHAEPIPSTGPYAQFKVMELARKNVVVTLDGQGADEELAGYHYFFGFYFKELLKARRFGKLGSEMVYYTLKHRSIYGLKTFLYFLLSQKSKTGLRVGEKTYLNSEFANKYQKSNSIAGNLYGSNSLHEALLDHFEYKLEHLLKWEDRNSMWFSIEARVPFLDYRLVEKTLATSSDVIMKNGMTKDILRRSMKGILPEKIRNRKDKIGFDTPQDEWFRDKRWEDLVIEVINSESFAGRKIINVNAAKRIFLSHLQAKTNSSKEIWKWIHLEYWFRTFID